VALLVLLSINLIACSEQRWPQMWKLATAKPVAWARETFERHDASLVHRWESSSPNAAKIRARLEAALESEGIRPTVVEEGQGVFQFFWQAGRWSRLSNYLVHTSLLVIFAGGIWSSMSGFEGAANIPAGSAVDTLLLFKEGKASGLQPAPGGLANERLFGFRVQAENFAVKFYEDWPGRPSEFVTKVNFIEQGKVMDSAELRVNEPHTYRNFTFYQASYGKMGNFNVSGRIVDKSSPTRQALWSGRLGEPQNVGGFEFVPLAASADVQSLGPGVQVQELADGKPVGVPFWVLKDFPQFDFESRKEAPLGLLIDQVEEQYFTGLQIGYDPGAPIYWLGCIAMLLGTFYALMVTHRKYYLRFDNGEVRFAGTVHRLPGGFAGEVLRLAELFRNATGDSKDKGILT
jgi:cytochrome c biogenesis protein